MVTWKINADGTATNTDIGFMWVRAPWGMQWDGHSFSGTPTKVPWKQASEMFGRGGWFDSGMASMNEEQLTASQYPNEYEHGNVTVEFAGYSDWRLPTGAESTALVKSFHPDKDWEDREKIFTPEFTRNRLWTCNGRHKLDMDNLAGKIWSVFDKTIEDRSYIAYAYGINEGMGTHDIGTEQDCLVGFVRKM